MKEIDESKLRKDPQYFNMSELKPVTVKEDTGRSCAVCNKPIKRIYSTEVDKQTGDIVTAVCLWDRRYTCGESCSTKWINKAEQDFIGNSSMTEIGQRLYRKIADPKLKEYRISDSPDKWGHSMIYSADQMEGRKRFLEASIEDIEERFANEHEDYFSIKSEEV